MDERKLSKAFLDRLRAITDKRPKTVIEHIIKHGFITTQQLRDRYGYNHPPRAAKDVRDQGVPLETFRVKGQDGRSIAAYRFADLSKIRRGFLGGRRAFPKDFKKKLAGSDECRCFVCLTLLQERYLQIDHRIPYEVAGDGEFDAHDLTSYMLVCGSCNRAKSWSCEHCQNWNELKLTDTCKSCYWASPKAYSHIAMQNARRLDITWLGDETEVYDRMKEKAESKNDAVPEYVKKVLRRLVGGD